MAFLLKGKKEDLISVASELGIEVNAHMTKIMIKDLIVKNSGYNEEDIKGLLDGISEERRQAEEHTEKKRIQELELEEKKEYRNLNSKKRKEYRNLKKKDERKNENV
ncbi:hypothetical protein AVEN_63829-1 [Araneus ventricosus]|uniref:Uncharacterized protein n=1 Tax=Araneus ventricosus TaxID=182803 RepID=A0A4Y2FW37_ARAVE|nr:hypothetical protein AVEN_63829-1 [Araneus ventricosus]